MFVIPQIPQIILCFASVLAGIFLVRKTPGFVKGLKSLPGFLFLALANSALLFTSEGSVRDFAFVDIMTYAAISDMRTHKVSNAASVALCLVSLIGLTEGQMVAHLGAGIVMFGLLFAFALAFKHFGGADVKIIAASTMFLGAAGGLSGTIIGLLLAVIASPVVKKVKKLTKHKIPLIPYVAVGYFVYIAVKSTGLLGFLPELVRPLF